MKFNILRSLLSNLHEYSGPGFHHVYRDWEHLAKEKGGHHFKYHKPPKEFGDRKGHTIAYNKEGRIVGTWNHHYNHGMLSENFEFFSEALQAPYIKKKESFTKSKKKRFATDILKMVNKTLKNNSLAKRQAD